MKSAGARLVALLTLAACASSHKPAPQAPAEAQPTRPLADYMRVVPRNGETVAQTSVRKLSRARTGTVVVLVSVQHVGERAYYEGLGEQLRDASIVLAEGTGGRPPGKPLPDADLPEEGLWLRREERVIARLLGLERQSDWEERVVDRRWILADMGTAQLASLMAKSRVSFLSDEEKASVEEIEALVAGKPDEATLAQARADVAHNVLVGAIDDRDPPGAERDLHEQREEVMWRIIRDHLVGIGATRVALVYGAWHAPYLESRLVRELGFEVDSTRWYDAMTIDETLDVAAD